MKTIKYKYEFSKLKRKTFTTIRMNNQEIKSGEIVCHKTLEQKFKAECVGYGTIRFKNIPPKVLIDDMDLEIVKSKNIYKQALDFMKEFYKDIEMDSDVYIYNFRKCE